VRDLSIGMALEVDPASKTETHTVEACMKSTALWALIILNAVLLISFVSRLTPGNTALAQRAPAGAPGVARPGDYIMIPANVTGANAGIIVVVDQTAGQLSAFSFDDANRTLSMMQKIDLRRVFQGGATPARRGGTRQ
jgi:hypothetical protein